MRIGLVIYGSLDTVSGGYLYDRKLLEYLARQGEQVEIVSLPWRNYSRHLADNLSASLHRRLSRLDVDVLLQDELNHPSLFWINRQLKGRFPLVSIVHHLRASEAHPGWLLGLYRRVERMYLTSLDSFIFNSQTTRRAVEALSGGQQPGVVAYPGGDQYQPQIDLLEIAARARQPGPLRLFFLGNLIPRKGLHTLLAALELMPPESAELSVAGGYLSDSPYTRALRRQIETLEERVHMLGALDAASLSIHMRHQHVIVVPSSYEGFGIAYLEGMGFGLPAVATTSGGATEIITHAQDGYLLPPDDPRSLAEILTTLAADRELLAALGAAARRRYLAHSTWDQAGAAIHEFLLRLLAKRSPSSSRI